MFSEGERIGDWIVETPLGAGGMGTVYRCHNALTPRIRAAVKIVAERSAPDVRERFVREVEALERLQHPAVVRVKGWGEHEGVLWLAMDFVEGEDLNKRMARGPLDVQSARRVFGDLARGLEHAHERDVIHRDIKPANVLLLPDGEARLVDFGIAMQGGRTRVSTAGSVPGTPAYLAPEVFGGVPDGRMADIYALGQVLHEALIGRSAFPEPDALTTTGRLAHVAGQKLRAGPLDPGAAIPNDLRTLVQRATEPNPARRVPSMTVFAEALEGVPLPPPAEAPATMDFRFDEVQPDLLPDPPDLEQTTELAVGMLPPMPGPLVTPSPVVRRSRRWLWGPFAIAWLVVGLMVGWIVNQPRTRDVSVVVTGLPADTPHAVVVAGARAERHGDGRFYAATLPRVAVPIEVAAGAQCDTTGWHGGTCPSCCACVTATAEVGSDEVVVQALLPDGHGRVHVVVTGVADSVPVTISVDGAAPRTGALTATFDDVPVGERQVTVEAGTCDLASRGCATNCPPGCASIVEQVDVGCDGGTVNHIVSLSLPPPAPAATRRAAPPAPAAPSHPELRGLKVRLMHRFGKIEMAEEAAERLTRHGSAVEISAAYGGPVERFYGYIYYYGAENEKAADTAARMLRDLGYLQTMEEGSDSDLDLTVWMGERH